MHSPCLSRNLLRQRSFGVPAQKPALGCILGTGEGGSFLIITGFNTGVENLGDILISSSDIENSGGEIVISTFGFLEVFELTHPPIFRYQ